MNSTTRNHKPPSPWCEAALAGEAAGLGMNPPNGPGHPEPKSPLSDRIDGKLTWKHLQSERRSRDELEALYANGRTWVGVHPGAVSRGLELFEFDDFDTFVRFLATAEACGLGELVKRIRAGYEESTPGGGIHWFYFCDEVRGNTKLAERETKCVLDGPPIDPDTGEPIESKTPLGFFMKGVKTRTETLIETRGEGGFAVVAPTIGLHEDGRGYELRSGGFDTIVKLTPEERDALWDLARTFDEKTSGEEERERADEIRERVDLYDGQPGKTEASGGREEDGGYWEGETWIPDGLAEFAKCIQEIRPGDDFNARTTWEEVLPGWARLHTRADDVTYWRRPGKDHGWSATTNRGGRDRLNVYTSSTAFTPVFSGRKTYDKFGAYAALHHSGALKAAAKALAERGFGTYWDAEAEAWKQNPRPKPREPEQSKGEQQKATGGGTSARGDPGEPTTFAKMSRADLGILLAEEVEDEAIEWLDQDRVAVGKMHLTAGEGGDGKSQTEIANVAAFTAGKPTPCGGTPSRVGTCIILAPEDGYADVVKPRLVAAGADMSMVRFLTAKYTLTGKDGKKQIHPVDFQRLDYWRAVFEMERPVYFVADPVPAFLGRGVNDHRNADVRAVLEPFGGLCLELGVTWAAVTHLGKSPDLRTPTHKILGSVAYSNLARIVHVTARDPESRERRYWFQVKNNYAPLQPPLSFTIEPHEYTAARGKAIRTSRVAFETTPVDVDPIEVMGCGKRGPKPEKTEALAAWLFDHLKDRPQPEPLGAIVEAAGEAGFLGKRKDDGKWSNFPALYRALKLVPKLPPPRDGSAVDETEVEQPPVRLNGRVVSGGRPRKYWALAQAEPEESGCF